MILLFLFSFISGFVTILAPCIWPLLPIILSTSATGKEFNSHRKPLGITLGIMLSFLVFTLTISTLVKLFHFDANILRLFAVLIIGFLSLTLIIPWLSNKIEVGISRLTGLFGRVGNNQSNGFVVGFLTGLSLGIVWSPCAGPILATIATLAATSSVTLIVVLVTIFYVAGMGIPLFLFAYGGRVVFTRTRFLSAYTGRIQQLFGFIILLTAFAIFTHFDTYLEASLLNTFPQFGTTLNNFENNSVVKKQLDALKGKNASDTVIYSTGILNANSPAPDFTGATKWLNTPSPLMLKDLKGKVVLVDFWTYTCINCIRSLPYVTSWYDKYKNQGFVVIGVHTPEFEFEKNTNNVQEAIKRFNIHYPVPQDNNYAIWNNFNNQYWPAEYLIDASGIVRRTHFGEGEYDVTEKAIQTLLLEAGKKVNQNLVQMPDDTPQTTLSPETYFGSNRMQFYYPDRQLPNGTKSYTLQTDIPTDSYSLSGTWTIEGENAVAGNNAVVEYHFAADKVFAVLRPKQAASNDKIKVFLDGKPLSANFAGSDATNGTITVDSDRLYNVIDLRNHSGSHVLRLEFQTPGTKLFTYTFG